MIETRYNPDDDSLQITLGTGATETVNFKEFMDGIPTERARIESILSRIADVKKKRIYKIDEYMKIIEDLYKKETEVRTKMEVAAEEGDSGAVKSLRFVVQSVLDEKNIIREMRYAIKLLDNDEGRLMSELADLTI